MVFSHKYSVPYLAFWPTFIMGSADHAFGGSYVVLGPISRIFLPFYVPNVRRLRTSSPRTASGPVPADQAGELL
jgi:hypothetical protein